MIYKIFCSDCELEIEVKVIDDPWDDCMCGTNFTCCPSCGSDAVQVTVEDDE
jgi:hypothetical protein